MKKEDLKNYTKNELDDMFVNLINEMEKEGYRYRYIDEWKKDDDRLEWYTYGGALLTRVNRIKAMISVKNSNMSDVTINSDCDYKNCIGQIEYYRFRLGVKKYGYDSEFRKVYESMTAQLRHDELNKFFDEWDVPKN